MALVAVAMAAPAPEPAPAPAPAPGYVAAYASPVLASSSQFINRNYNLAYAAPLTYGGYAGYAAPYAASYAAPYAASYAAPYAAPIIF